VGAKTWFDTQRPGGRRSTGGAFGDGTGSGAGWWGAATERTNETSTMGAGGWPAVWGARRAKVGGWRRRVGAQSGGDGASTEELADNFLAVLGAGDGNA